MKSNFIQLASNDYTIAEVVHEQSSFDHQPCNQSEILHPYAEVLVICQEQCHTHKYTLTDHTLRGIEMVTYLEQS